VGFCAYLPSVEGKFTSDVYSWIGTYKEMGWSGLWTSFGDPGYHPVYHLLTFGLYQSVGLSAWIWQLVFVGLHAMNAYFLSRLLAYILMLYRANNQVSLLPIFFISTLAGLLFLLSPYQTEAVVWGATIHYLVCVLGLLSSLFYACCFVIEQKNRFAFFSFIGFAIALYSLELALVQPVLWVLFLIFVLLPRISTSFVKKGVFAILFPQILLIVLFFLQHKYLYGKWIGHYGAETHLSFSLNKTIGAFNQYLLKFFTYFRYWTIESKKILLESITGQTAVIITLLLVVMAGFYLIFYVAKTFRNRKKQVLQVIKRPFYLQLIIVFFAAFAVALLPVINLELTSLQNLQSDRYGYFASVFFYGGFTLLIAALFKEKVGAILLIVLCGISSVLLWNTSHIWKEAGQTINGLIADYRWMDTENVFVLNLPDNYKGAYLYRNGFRESLEEYHGRSIAGNIERVAWYNMLEPTDSVTVEVIDDENLKVELVKWGRWWWYYGGGASSYENETQRFNLKGIEYELLLKNLDKEKTAVIYQCGNQWREVAF